MTMRVACAIAILLLVGAGAVAPAHAAAPRSESAPAPAAVIDIGGIFGDENEPDENETDEGDVRRSPPSNQRSGVSIPVALLLIALAALVGGYVAIKVRRAWLRLVGWGRGLWARL